MARCMTRCMTRHGRVQDRVHSMGVGLAWVWRAYGAASWCVWWRVYGGVGTAWARRGRGVCAAWARRVRGVCAAWARRVPAGARICSLPASTSQQLQPGAPSRHSVAYLVRGGGRDRDRDRGRDGDRDNDRVSGQKKGYC
jgi:hypothetical protein